MSQLQIEPRSTTQIEEHPLGAVLTETGVAFGVWAPHATSVAVIGSFNEWSETAHPCVRDDNGNWRCHVDGAKAGDEYRYFITNGAWQAKRIDPRAKHVTNSVGNAVVTDPAFDWKGDQFELPPWNELVIYEMHVGTFNPHRNSVGTFAEAVKRLSYLKQIGVNVVELMPLAEFAGDYSWGYNPAHPFAIETAYGGPLGMKTFVREAHKLDIGVVVDVVYNHFGPSDLDMWQFDGWQENDKGGIYFYNDWRSSTPWGDTRPDYGRGEVRQYIHDNAMMWLEDYRADGLRYDMTLYMRSVDGDESREIEEGFSLAQWVNREIGEKYPNKITIAEDLRNNPRMTLDDQAGGAKFGSQWDASFVHPIRKVLIEVDDANRSMESVRAALEFKYNHDVFERVIYTESHDEVANGKQRVVSEIDPSEAPNRYAIKRSTLGACLVFTAPGIPMILQGQEFLRDKWFDDSRPIDWERCAEYEGIVRMYSDLAHMRRNVNGKTAGLSGQHLHVYHVNDEAKMIAFRRWKEGGIGDDCVIIVNFSEGRDANYRVGFPFPGHWSLEFNSDAKVYNDLLDDTPVDDVVTEQIPIHGFEQSAMVAVGAYSCLVFSRTT